MVGVRIFAHKVIHSFDIRKSRPFPFPERIRDFSLGLFNSPFLNGDSYQLVVLVQYGVSNLLINFLRITKPGAVDLGKQQIQHEHMGHL